MKLKSFFFILWFLWMSSVVVFPWYAGFLDEFTTKLALTNAIAFLATANWLSDKFN